MKCRNSHDPLVMVDDSKTDKLIAERVYKKSELKNPLLMFGGGAEFFAYLEEVAKGEVAMPAFVLLDINMPQMSGFDVLERLRDDDQFREVPIVVMLTNSDNPSDYETSIRLGANAFVTKPFKVDKYIEFMNSLASE